MAEKPKDTGAIGGLAGWKMHDGRLSLVCLECDQVIGTSTRMDLSHWVNCPARQA